MDCFQPPTMRSSWRKRRDTKPDLGRQTSDLGIQAPWLLRSDVQGPTPGFETDNPTDGELHLINFYALFT